MPGNTFGYLFKITSFGESHGSCVGGVVDGMPSNIPFDEDFIQEGLNARRPGAHNLQTSRNELDKIQVLSGIWKGKTTGAPIAFVVQNNDSRSKDYDLFSTIYRPGHADYTYHHKYGNYDYRGGGRASARETAVRVAAGRMALMALKFFIPEIKVRACVTQIGEHGTESFDWEHVCASHLFSPCSLTLASWTAYLSHIKEQGLSVGAKIYVEACGVPKGLGEPVFDKLNADIAKAMISINAAKAIEFGSGFSCLTEKGYDEIDKNGFLTNRSGGTLAGISTSQPVTCHVWFKGTSSTHTPRKTLDYQGKQHTISIFGRHDPCVGIRAVPIVQGMMSLVLMDHFLRSKQARHTYFN